MARLPQSDRSEPYQKDGRLLLFYCIRNNYVNYKFTYTVEMCIYSMYIRYILYRCACPTLFQSYTTQHMVVNPLTPKKYTLNGYFDFDLRDLDFCDFFFQEIKAGVKRDLLVQNFKKTVL